MVFGFMDKDYTKKYSAYTLAEMLVVLVIISVVLISLPTATKKLFKVENVKTYHGRFECYWENDKLKYYYAKERPGLSPEFETGELEGDSCEFVPPLTYHYIMIHAVGGGGAGGVLTETVSEPVIGSSYTEYLPGSDYQDRWFLKFYDSVINNDSLNSTYKLTGTDSKDVYSTMISTRQVALKYRKSGLAGAVSSMFFPFIPTGNKFYLYPGKGGALGEQDVDGANGAPSVVQVVKHGETCDIEDKDATCNIIWAAGGAGASVLDSGDSVINLVTNAQLLGGKNSDFGISAYKDVKFKKSGFSDIIDKVNASETLSSKIPSDAGDGGNGANHFVKDSTLGFFFHEFDNFNGKTGNSQGVNWVSISNLINAQATYDANCENKSSGVSSSLGSTLYITRSNSNGDISTQCTPYGPYYTCAVGHMFRDITGIPCSSACDTSLGKCACYTFTASGTQTDSTGDTSYYSNPVFDTATHKMTIKETVDDDNPHISCPAGSGYKYTIDGTSTPCEGNTEFDAAKGICKAKKGGDGAIVVLW